MGQRILSVLHFFAQLVVDLLVILIFTTIVQIQLVPRRLRKKLFILFLGMQWISEESETLWLRCWFKRGFYVQFLIFML